MTIFSLIFSFGTDSQINDIHTFFLSNTLFFIKQYVASYPILSSKYLIWRYPFSLSGAFASKYSLSTFKYSSILPSMISKTQSNPVLMDHCSLSQIVFSKNLQVQNNLWKSFKSYILISFEIDSLRNLSSSSIVLPIKCSRINIL